MRRSLRSAALLVALVFVFLPSLVAAPDVVSGAGHHHVAGWLLWGAVAIGAAGLAGAVNITYQYPTAGATAPTQPVMSGQNLFTANVFFADGDTQAIVTHNMQIPAADLTALMPLLRMVPVTVGTAFPGFNFVLATNSVTINKANTSAGTGGTFNLVVERPASLVR